jgi:hypothetical protein
MRASGRAMMSVSSWDQYGAGDQQIPELKVWQKRWGWNVLSVKTPDTIDVHTPAFNWMDYVHPDHSSSILPLDYNFYFNHREFVKINNARCMLSCVSFFFQVLCAWFQYQGVKNEIRLQTFKEEWNIIFQHQQNQCIQSSKEKESRCD